MMNRLSVDELLKIADIAVEGHILKDTISYLEELLKLRTKVTKLERQWQVRCFYPDCNEEMSGATIYPVPLAHCLTHRVDAERINSNETLVSKLEDGKTA